MKIGIWGDSITYGECDSEGLGWVGRLRKAMLDSASIYNRGICGDTTDDLLKRFSIEADSIAPDLIVFAIGINDSKFPVDKDTNKVPLEEFKRNLRELLTQAQEHTKKIYFVGLTRVQEDRINPTGSKFMNSEIQKYDDFVKELAELEGATFISTAAALDTHAHLADGLHPNAQGYQEMFEVVFRHIKD